MKICKEENCERPYIAHGLCQRHYQLWYRSTEAGKNRDAKYSQSEKGIVSNKSKAKRFSKTEKYKLIRARYRNSERGKATEKAYEDYYRKTEAGKAKVKRYYATEKGKATRARGCRKWHEKLRMATPNWANIDAIVRMYEQCPEGYAVDHIIPLNSESVSGLHVESNLQYLTRSENSRKGNKFNP